MSPTAVILNPLESRTTSAVSEVLSLALGAGFTLVLFLAVALFQATETPAPDPDITELHAMAMPLDTPPPRPLEKEPVAVAAVPFAGFLVRGLWAVQQPRPVPNMKRFGFTEVGVELLGGALIAAGYLLLVGL